MNTIGTTGLVMNEPLIFERSSEGKRGIEVPKSDVGDIKPEDVIPADLLRADIEGFPEVSEVDVVRHFTRMSQWNYGVDTGMYPLGSCTMKYNPKVNEDIARLPGFSRIHPYQPEELSQGALQLMYELEQYLAEISGMDAVTLQPAAGAQGELCGMLMISAYFASKGRPRKKVIIPDTAHGTNPASVTLAGLTAIPVKSGSEGALTPEAVKAVMDEDTAGIMITNPNTLGLFERHIKEIADIVHEKGGFVYCDGANMNALLGAAKLGDMGVDVVHMNLHKTFSTPHGGGGPGSGPVGVKKELEPFLPVPRVIKKDETYSMDYKRPDSIGRLRAFYGNFGVLVRAYAYIRAMGAEGLKKAAQMAVLNANYVKENLKSHYHLPFDQPCMHECVFSDKLQFEKGFSTMDIAKRLMDYGFHPPTTYFPLVVHDAIMIEPTETEDKGTLDSFIDAMKRIAEEDPELVKGAPYNTKTKRLDEAKAARNPVLKWEKAEN
ncbi:MAG: aminomethyl-transferring glycine dehydrogenase subunit GcvPB [Deltaproteobacteria bacterium]|nr:aminomethyl-transferring glycine dehydrogenase subunit GcvPB [Deltaproteobacteria bacterium]